MLENDLNFDGALARVNGLLHKNFRFAFQVQDPAEAQIPTTLIIGNQSAQEKNKNPESTSGSEYTDVTYTLPCVPVVTYPPKSAPDHTKNASPESPVHSPTSSNDSFSPEYSADDYDYYYSDSEDLMIPKAEEFGKSNAESAEAKETAEKSIPATKSITVEVTTGVPLYQQLKLRCASIENELKKRLDLPEFIQWHKDQYKAITAPLYQKLASIKSHLHSFASEGKTVGLKTIIDQYNALKVAEVECAERARRVNKLATDVFESPRLVMVKTRNAILNEWIDNLYERNTADIDDNEKKSKSAEDDEDIARTWEEEMLRLCIRYHAELKAKSEIEFVKFLIEHRSSTVSYLPGQMSLKTRTTLEKSEDLVQVLSELVENKIAVLKSQIEVTIEAMEQNDQARREIEIERVTIPKHLGEILFNQVIFVSIDNTCGIIMSFECIGSNLSIFVT